MPLSRDGQVMVRGLVMGPGTDFVINSFNPYSRLTRAPYSGEDPYGDGGYSGPEWLEPVQISLSVHVAGNTTSNWWALHTQLMQALRPVRDEPIEPEIHWRVDGQEFMMFARPRALDANIRNLRTGDVTNACSLLALDPSIYSGGENGLHSVTLGMYRTAGGLHLPFGLPVAIRSVVEDGQATITNAGVEPTPLVIRIDGPVVHPRLTFNGSVLWFDLSLETGEWLEIDTHAESVLQNGITSRLPEARGTFPVAFPGDTTVQYSADEYNDKSTAHITWRDRW